MQTLPEAQNLLREAVEMLKEGRNLLHDSEVPGDDLEPGPAARITELEETINARIQELSALGVDVKGLEPGLLDFPALRYGQKVYLCWKEGEDTITHWHPLEGGFVGRKPLSDTEEGAWEWCN